MNHLKQKQSHSPWIICSTASLFFFYIMFQMSVFNTISGEISRDYGIESATILGFISSLYFYIAAIALIPASVLLDKYSIKKQSILLMILCVFCTMLFAVSDSLYAVIVYRVVCGLCNAFAFLICMRLTTLWFAPSQRGFAMGVMVTIGMMGGVIQPLFKMLATHYTWRQAMMIDGLIGIGIIVLLMMFVKDKNQVESPASQQSLFSPLLLSIKQLQCWLCGLFAALINMPIFLLGALWGNLMVSQVYQVSTAQASLVISMLFWGIIVGSPIIGYVSDRVGSRRNPMLIVAVASLMLTSLILFSATLSLLQLMIIFFLIGFFSSGQVISLSLVSESVPSTLVSTSLSIVSILVYLAGGLSEPLYGWVLSTIAHSNNFHAYTAVIYKKAFFLVPVAFIISTLAVLFVKDTARVE